MYVISCESLSDQQESSLGDPAGSHCLALRRGSVPAARRLGGQGDRAQERGAHA
jgi:hypothetical protein